MSLTFGLTIAIYIVQSIWYIYSTLMTPFKKNLMVMPRYFCTDLLPYPCTMVFTWHSTLWYHTMSRKDTFWLMQKKWFIVDFNMGRESFTSLQFLVVFLKFTPPSCTVKVLHFTQCFRVSTCAFKSVLYKEK